MGGALAERGFAAAWQAVAFKRSAASQRLLSVRLYLILLILAVVAPLLGFGGYLVLRSAVHEEQMLGGAVRERTREAASLIDQELAALRPRLFMLGSSPSIRDEDFSRFRDEAETEVRQDGLGAILTDAAGRTLAAVGTAASTAVMPAPDVIRRVLANGRPDVSNLVGDASGDKRFIFLAVPVMRDGRPAYVLSLDIAPLLPRLIAALGLPSDWLVAISDRAGYTIARSRAADRFVGQLGRPAVLERFRSADQGWFPVVSRDGIPLYNAFARAAFSGWVIDIGIPEADLYAPVRGSTRILMAVGGTTVGFAVLLGLAIGRRLSGAITGLVGYAEAVGRGEQIAPLTTGVVETDAVARSLHLANEQLRQNAQERALLLDRTVTAQETERRRIARELHDSLAQYLTALRLGFSALESYCAGNADAQRRLAELKTLAATLSREVNRIAWELRPMALDDLGLQRAVTQYLEEWAERSRLRIDLEIEVGDRRLPQRVETALFRVLQEAIRNVTKHSGADRVGVILQATDGEVRLIVEDNGRGFDLAGELGMQHLGLLGLRERLALVGGSLEVETSAENGTTLYVRIPL